MTAIVLVSLYMLCLTAATASARGASSDRVAMRRHITRAIVATHYWQTIMGVSRTPTRYEYKHRRGGMLRFIARKWHRVATETHARYQHPWHKSAWLCIHRYEGSWRDADDPYWGGLQMDRGFMFTYAPLVLLRRGFANRWSALEQMWVAERAHRSGRGYWPWPTTARFCGLL